MSTECYIYMLLAGMYLASGSGSNSTVVIVPPPRFFFHEIVDFATSSRPYLLKHGTAVPLATPTLIVQ